MKKVFISYSSAEYEHASKYRQAFTEKGIHCWMAPESIPVGSNYAVEIPKAIQDAQVFVLILSENSQNSKWVRKEIDLAVNLNKAIFPVRISNGQLISPFSFYLADVQMIQANDDTEIVAERLLAILEPNEAKTGFDAVTASNPAPIPSVAPAAPVAQNGGSNKALDFIKSHKIPLIAAAAVAVVGIGVGVGVAVSSGGNAPAVDSGVVSEVEGDAADAMANVNINDIQEVTDIEFTLVYGTGNNEYVGTFSGEAAEGKIPHGTGKFVGTDKDGITMTFEGGFAYGKLEGEGSYVRTYPEESEYKEQTCTATFKNSLIEGKSVGETVYKNGDVIETEGNYIDGKANGKGKQTWNYANGDIKVIEGDLVDDKWHGQAKQTLVSVSDGYTRIYEGGYSNGNWHGYAVQTIKETNGDSSIYEGNFTNGYRGGQGKCTYTYANGDVKVYEGNWVNSNWQGEGKCTYTYANGETYTYEGKYDNGNRDGFGKWLRTYVEGDYISYSYEGDWKDDKINGHGVEVWTFTDGRVSTYDCDFKESKRNGQGSRVTVYPEGNDYLSIAYEGEWSDNNYNGKGKETYNYADGTVTTYECEFKDGKKNGQGKQTIIYPEGNERTSYTYEGEFADNKRSGQGKLTVIYSEGNKTKSAIYEGEWSNGLFHGKGKLTYYLADGTTKVEEGEWKEDKFVG